MKRIPLRFAFLDSGGPHIVNLQMEFWSEAIRYFERACDCDPEADTDDEFIALACLAVVAAGTSVSVLLGANTPANADGMTPSVKRCFENLLPKALSSGADVARDIKARFAYMNELYEGVRHFGEAKYSEVLSVDSESLCECMATAQDVWRMVFASSGRRPPWPLFLCNEFEFEDE